MTQLMPHDPAVRVESQDDLAQKRSILRRIEQITRGGVNWVGEVTLVEEASGTTVQDDRITENSQISLTPLTIEAAAIASSCYVQVVRPGVPWAANRIGEFVIRHPAPKDSSCLFRYSVKG